LLVAGRRLPVPLESAPDSLCPSLKACAGGPKVLVPFFDFVLDPVVFLVGVARELRLRVAVCSLVGEEVKGVSGSKKEEGRRGTALAL